MDIAMLAQLKPAAINQQLVVLLYMKHTPGFNPQEQCSSSYERNPCEQGSGEGIPSYAAVKQSVLSFDGEYRFLREPVEKMCIRDRCLT